MADEKSLKLFYRWRALDLIGSTLGTLGLVIAIADYESSFPASRQFDVCGSPPDNNLKMLVFGLTLLAISVMIWKGSVKARWKRAFYRSAINSSTTRETLLIIACLLLFPYPFFSGEVHVPLKIDGEKQVVCYRLSELLLAIMFCRLCLLAISLLNFTKHRNYCARRFSQVNDMHSGTTFSLKCMMNERPIYFVVLAIGVPLMLITGFVLRIFERPAAALSDHNFDDIAEALYFLAISLMSAGYGNYSPVTMLGKVCILFATFISAFLLSLLVVSLEKNIDFTFRQEKAFALIEKRHAAAAVIQRGLQWYCSGKTPRTLKLLEEAIQEFKDTQLALGERKKSSDKDIVEIKYMLGHINSEVLRLYQSLIHNKEPRANIH